MAADARLCALAHLDFNGGAGFQVIFMDTETTGCNLDDGVRAVLVEVLVQTALTGVVVGAELDGRAGERCVRVVGNRTVAHGREHDRSDRAE